MLRQNLTIDHGVIAEAQTKKVVLQLFVYAKNVIGDWTNVEKVQTFSQPWSEPHWDVFRMNSD